MSRDKRLGLFGGTFDPPHLGHLIVAEWLSSELGTEKTLFVPAHIHPFKSKRSATNASERLAMLKSAIKPFPQFDICSYELERNETSYTIETVRYIQECYPGYELWLFTGEDNLQAFDKWKDPEGLLKLAKLAVFRRGKVDKTPWHEHPNIFVFDTPHVAVSSSAIRSRVAQGKEFRSLVPFEVYSYIVKHKLYTTERDTACS